MAVPRTRRAIRELKPHELPPHKGSQPKAGKGPKGNRAPESVGGSVISIKSNPNVQTEVRTLKDGSQVVVKTGQGPPAASSAAPAPAAPAPTTPAPAAPASTAAPKKREVERVETQRKPSAARPDDEIETLKPKAQHILVKSPGGATKQYDIPHIPQGVTVRGTATFVKALKVIDTEAKVRRRRRAEKVDAVDGKLLIPKDDTNQDQKGAKGQQQDQKDAKGHQQGQKEVKGQQQDQKDVKSQQQGQKDSKGQLQGQKGHQQQGHKGHQQQQNKKSQLQARRRRRAAPTPATSATSSSTTETVSEGQQDEGTVKIYGTLEGEMVKVKGYIKGDLTGAASAYVVPTLLSRYGDFVQGARNGEFFNDQGQQGGQRGEVGFYGSAAQRSLNGLNQRAQYGDSQAGQQGQRRDNGYYGNQQGVKSGHDIGRNFDTGQAFDKKGASGTYEDKNGNHRKGFKNAGFRNTYHKDESANSTSFFDDLNDEGGHKAFDQTGKTYLDQGAAKNRGDFLNAAFVNDGAGKQGGFDGGTAYQDVRAQAGNTAHHDGFDDRAKLDYQHHGNNHGGTQTQGGKYFNGGGSFNQAEVAAAGGKRGGGGFHGMQRTGTGESRTRGRGGGGPAQQALTGSLLPSGGGGGVGFQGGFQNLGSSSGGDGGGFQTGSNGFQTGSNGFQSGSNGFQSGASGFQGGAGGGFRGGSTAGFQGGSTGFQGSSDFLGGRDGGGGGSGFQSSVITSSGLYDPSSAVRNSNPYPYYPPPSPVPLMGRAGNGQGVLDLRGGTFYQGGGYRSQFLPEPAPMGPLTPLAFAPSSNKAMTSSLTSSPTPSAYHRFSKSSFRIGGEQDTGPNAGPDAVRGKGFATWETFGNSAQATSLRYALLAMPGLSRA
ncbi:hypothetical protein FOCC_FOCC005811 [Frankliniella occidentalis]|nr:hypothetical protein FOCC_FOCC005811 [Frankliniella occidentalis]